MEEISLKIEVVFYNYEQGGRKTTVNNNYRTSILFGLTESQASMFGRLPIEGVDFSLNSSGKFTNFSFHPTFNKKTEAILTFRNYNPKIKKYLIPKEYFIVFEASKIVGKGVIIELLDSCNG